MAFPNDLFLNVKGTTSFCEQGATIVNRQELDTNSQLIRSCLEPEVGMPCSDESPTLSPASPSFLQGPLKPTGARFPRHNEIDHSDDPFLFDDREQTLFGGTFNQNHDTTLGDLRLR